MCECVCVSVCVYSLEDYKHTLAINFHNLRRKYIRYFSFIIKTANSHITLIILYLKRISEEIVFTVIFHVYYLKCSFKNNDCVLFKVLF